MSSSPTSAVASPGDTRWHESTADAKMATAKQQNGGEGVAPQQQSTLAEGAYVGHNHGQGPQRLIVNGHHHDEEEDEEEGGEGAGGEEAVAAPSRLASVIVIGGASGAPVSASEEPEAGGDRDAAATVEGAGSVSRVESSVQPVEGCFDNAAFVDDEGGGRQIFSETPPPPIPPSTTPPQGEGHHGSAALMGSAGHHLGQPRQHQQGEGGANGLGPAVMESPSSPTNLNNSGLIMATPSEKAELEAGGGVAEAVNLELVNMNPYGALAGAEDLEGKSNNGGLNGIPVKRGDEEMGVDGAFGDPYDEYFVPVNEHRKYIRGEKLYVTKDRRRSQSWRRCICWGVGFTLLAIAILIAVLAGTGVILSQEPEGAVEGRSFSSSVPHVAESKDRNAPIDRDRPPTVTELPPEPSSSFTPPPSMSSIPFNPPTTEMSGLYVPRVLEAGMRIDSLEYTSDLGNSSSDEYKRLARDLEDELKTALFDYRTISNGPADIFIKVTGFQPGSVMAKFHIGWRFKDSFPSPNDPIDADTLKDRLDAYLLKNGGYLYTYHVSTGSVAASNIIDVCQIDNGGCSHECRYDYQEASFTCNCPPGLYLDQTEKKCSSDLVDNTMAATEGPKFDEGPWLPMMPEEPVLTEDAAKSSEDSHEGGDIHHHGDNVDHVHEPVLTHDIGKPSESFPEVVDTDHHGDTVAHAFEPAITEDATKPSEGSHEDRDVYHHRDTNDYVHKPILTQDVEKPSEGSHDNRDIYHHGDAIAHDHHSLNEADGGHHSHEAKPDGSGSEEKDHSDSAMSEEASPSLEDGHHDAHSHETVVPASVGTGRSGGSDEDMTPVWIHSPGGEGVSTEIAPSNEGMDKLGIPVDSSEDTSVEEHDSDEMHNAHKHDVSLESSEMSREDDSQGSVSKESNDHVNLPVSQMTSMESHEKGSEESDEHDADVVDVHYGDINVDLNSAFNDSGKEVDLGPLKGQIVSAVEHVIVKDSNESKEGKMEGHKVMMKEMLSLGHQSDDHSFGVMSAHDTTEEVVVGGQKGNVESEETTVGNIGGKDGTGGDLIGVDGAGGMDKVEGEGATKETVGDGEAPGAEGTIEHDPSTITIQDVNYVINHGETHKPSEGMRDVIDGVREVNVEEEKPQDGMEEASIDADGHKVDSVVHIKTDEGSNGQEFDSDKHVMDHDMVPVVTVGQDSAEGEGFNEMTAKMLTESDGMEMGHMLESKGAEEAAPEQLEAKGQGQVESPPGVEESSPQPPHEEGGGVGGEELMTTSVNGVEVAVDVSKGEIGREDEASPLIENGGSKKGLGEGVEEGSSPKEEQEGSLGGGREGIVVEDGQSEVMDAESKGTLKPSEETPLGDTLSLNPEEHLISEDDPNIVPVEETAKETMVDHIDLKKVVIPEIDVRLGGTKVIKEDNNEMEVTTMREDHSLEPEEKTEVTELKSEDQNNKDENSSSHNMSMSDVTHSSTSSPLENSIENLSDQHNSTDGVNHFPPAAENDLNAMPNHFLIPMAMNDESSISDTTSSVKDDESNDLQLHPQLDFPQAVSNQPTSTEAITEVVRSESGLPTITVNDSMASHGNEERHSMDGSQAITEEKLKKLISDTAAKLEAEIRMDSMPHVTTSTEPYPGMEEEKNAVVEDGVTPDSTLVVINGGDSVVSSESDEERTRQGGGRAQPDSNETPSLSTLPQDFSVENANTVHSISPTSPSTILEDPSKESHASDSPALVTLEHASTEDSTTAVKGTSAPEHSISLESDNNEQTNNLATMDGEDLVAISEGKDPLIRVSAIDVNIKATTEHTNEIVLTSVDHKNWPTTAPGAHNATTKGETTMDEVHKVEAKESKLGAHTKADPYEIPMKKKGEFKKPTHHEDELTKPLLFIKESKESSSKVDKMGLLPPPAPREGLIMSTPGGESEGDLLTTTVDTPPASPETISEAIVMPVLPPVDKGGERLNTIAEDDSGGRKDLGKPVVKESVTKDAGDETAGEPEVVKGDVEVPNEASMEEGMVKPGGENEKEGKGEAGVVEETVTPPENQEDTLANEETVTKGGEGAPGLTFENLEAKVKLSEAHSFKEKPLSEQTTTVTLVSKTEVHPKDADDGMDGEVSQVPETMPTDKDESTEEVMTTTTNDSGVFTTMVTPVELEAHKNMEEMLKEMGGFGEGGHRVVAKTGVEPSPPPGVENVKPTKGSVIEEMAGAETSSTPIVPVVSSTNSLSPSPSEEVMLITTPFASVVPSTTSLPSSSSEEVMAITSKEQSPTTTISPEDITAEVLVENIKQGNLTQNPEGLTNSTSSEGPVPTLMVHEIVTSHAISPAPQEVSMEDETTTVLPSNDSAQEMNTSMAEETPTTTLPDPETMLKEETSSIVGMKGVMANATRDTSTGDNNETESNSLHTNEKEENHIEGVGFEVPSSSVFPDLDKHHFPKCTSGQFQCANGTSLTPYSVIPISSSSVTSLAQGVACVPLSAKCDSINDCSDGSDELGCIEDGCPGNFQCSNGQCLKRNLVCNGIVDCNDESDEESCDTWQCQFDEFQCPSGRCIPILWLCDGKPDCDNHTDEHNCQNSCGNDEYLCPERWCIPMSWRCNGVPECANGEDEKLCDCSLEQVKCGTGGCVARAEVCDGVDQCPDQSDEWGCTRLHNETMKLEVRTSDDQWLPVCADQWDNKWSNFICQSFGYSRSVFTEYPTSGEVIGSSEIFMLKQGASISLPPGNGMRFPGMLQKGPSSLCTSGSIVEISCQEFTCGNHGLADGVAARLVGGDEAANGQWPSVALLYHTRERATCTGSIISPRWLIASYNCLHMRDKSLSPDGWVAFGGGSTFDKDKPETQIKIVKSIVPYPQVKYNRFLYNHDVALVELIEPLTFTRSVGAICLPEKPIEPRQLCVTAGWGYTSPGEINFSQYLHYLPVPTIELNECNSTKHYSGFITEDKICAGFTDAMHSPCYNDEGAPLMCVSEGGIWELQGVLSYHSNCGRGYHPSIFSSVTSVREWVRRVVGGRFERRSTFNVRRRRGRRRRQSSSSLFPRLVWT